MPVHLRACAALSVCLFCRGSATVGTKGQNLAQRDGEVEKGDRNAGVPCQSVWTLCIRTRYHYIPLDRSKLATGFRQEALFDF